MKKNNDIKSILKLDKVVFDTIEFKRLGFKNDNKLKLNLQTEIFQRQDEETYKVMLHLIGEKEDEYSFDIILSGFFSFRTDETIEQQLKDELISSNSVAILMPYLRSEVSILTAQPDVECVVLPVLNVNNMFGHEE